MLAPDPTGQNAKINIGWVHGAICREPVCEEPATSLVPNSSRVEKCTFSGDATPAFNQVEIDKCIETVELKKVSTPELVAALAVKKLLVEDCDIWVGASSRSDRTTAHKKAVGSVGRRLAPAPRSWACTPGTEVRVSCS